MKLKGVPLSNNKVKGHYERMAQRRQKITEERTLRPRRPSKKVQSRHQLRQKKQKREKLRQRKRKQLRQKKQKQLRQKKQKQQKMRQTKKNKGKKVTMAKKFQQKSCKTSSI